MMRRVVDLVHMLRSEALDRSAVEARQTRQLCQLLRSASSRVPFYRDLYASHGINVGAFRSLADLQSLPVIDKPTLRAAGRAAVADNAPNSRVTIRTSGSTGEPFEFPIDHRYDQWRKAQCLRPYLRAGQRLSDKVMHLTGRPRQQQPWFARLGLLREWQIDCASDPAQVFRAWTRLEPDVLQGYPSSLRLLASYCLERGQPLRPVPRLVFTDSELLTPDTRSLIEQAFGVPVIDIFGTFETDNIAYQCAAHQGYHVASDCVVLEIVRDGKVVPVGEEGEMVVTVLENRTSPFIRYNLKDIGRLSAQACPCGSPFPVLEVLQGRANDQIVLANGRRCTPPRVLTHMARFMDAIQHYQLRQLDIGRFELLIVPTGRFARSYGERVAGAIAATLENAAVKLRLVDAIPQDRSGKRRAFVSQLPSDKPA